MSSHLHGRRKRRRRGDTGATGLTGTFTTDFQHEFRAETGALLRRRLLWFIAIRGGFELILIVTAWASYLFSTRTPMGQSIANPIGAGALNVSFILLYALTLWYVLQRARRQEELLRLSQWLIFLEGTLWLAGRYVFETNTSAGFVLFSIMILHVVASIFFPWSAMQALRPILGIIALNAVALAIETAWRAPSTWLSALFEIILSLLIAVPGVANCAIRHSSRLKSFRFRHVVDRYGDLRRELTDARRIHEGLFPDTIEEGDLRFTYLYQPMRQIGGDFLFAREIRDERDGVEELSVVLTDVTGHGIAAALTVNRLHGELERVFAENPRVDPGEVLSLLNRYVHLTLARHSVYMTAICFRVRPKQGELDYASGGHPPAFLRAVNGTVDQLQSTAFVLGACRAEDFDPDPQTIRFGPGDALIAYTDGATEARGDDGRMLGITGIQRLIAGSGPRYGACWSEHILRTVDGPPADDTLVVELVHAGDPRRAKAEAPKMPAAVETKS